jgi:hypothetical protein
MDFQTCIYAGVLGSKYMSTLKRNLRPWLKDKMIKNIKVRGMTLSSIFKTYKIKEMDIVKLDVEDMEFEVLVSNISILKDIRSIVMQWHRPETRDLVVNLLHKHGFAIVYEEPREYGDIYFMNSRNVRL